MPNKHNISDDLLHLFTPPFFLCLRNLDSHNFLPSAQVQSLAKRKGFSGKPKNWLYIWQNLMFTSSAAVLSPLPQAYYHLPKVFPVCSWQSVTSHAFAMTKKSLSVISYLCLHKYSMFTVRLHNAAHAEAIAGVGE